MTGLPPRIALATHNPHKLRELGRICAGWPTEWVSVENHDPSAFPDVEETGATYLTQATVLAVHEAMGSRLPKRHAAPAGEHASDEENLRALIQAIRGIPASGRSARYRCVAALAWPDGRLDHVDGTCEGTLRTSPAGSGGFGYDPIFVPIGWGVTMAELTDDQKDRISHRGRAFRALRELLAGG